MGKVIWNRPAIDFFIDKNTQNHYTPDGVMLNKVDRQLVFVYGTLMTGYPRNQSLIALGEGRRVCYAYTANNDFVMYKPVQTRLRFPVVLRAECKTDLTGYIYGEVWSVQSDFIRYMDEIERNGDMYNRKKVAVSDVQGRGSFALWMYLGDKDYWMKKIEKGEVISCNKQTAPKGHYYYSNYEHLENIKIINKNVSV